MKSVWNLSETLKDDVLDRILEAREIDKDKFLNSSINNISNPFLLKDMEKAVVRLEKSIKSREKVCIFGDFDADGASSTALLMNGFKDANINVTYYIPKRSSGYGMSKKAIDKIKDCSLIVTVDCGISSFEEIEYAKELGIDVIVTDHHEIRELPKAYAVINPKREDNIFKFKYLSGVGTAYMLLEALFKSLGLDRPTKYLDIVTIGTVADVMPLLEENRIFVKKGLELLSNSSNLGLRTIVEESKLKSVTIRDINFSIAPLFNAAGRICDASKIVKLLTSKSKEEAKEIFDDIKSLNNRRKEIGKEMINSIEDLSSEELIVVANESFHQGIVGIVAARLVDKYNVPAIVLKIKEDGYATGSARGVEGVNLVSLLNQCSDLLEAYGGHEKAAGLTLKADKIDELRARLKEAFLKSEIDNTKVYNVDCSIYDFEISLNLISKLERLSPFGEGNPQPTFLLKSCQILNKRLIGKKKEHIMFDIKQNMNLKAAVWFNSSKSFYSISPSKKYDLIFTLEENFYLGKYSPKIFVVDIKESKESISTVDYYRKLYSSSFPMRSYITSNRALKEVSSDMITEEPLKDLLNILSNNYNFSFKQTAVEHRENDENVITTIEIDRCFKRDKKESMKSSINSIKRSLLGSLEYNSMQQKVLRDLLINKSNVTLLSKRGRGIDTIALTVAMYIKEQTGKKSLYLTNKKINKREIKEFFEISDSLKDAPFVFVDNRHIELDKFHLKFLDRDKFESVDGILDDFKVSDKIKIVKKNEFISALHRGLTAKHKNKIKENILKADIVAERDILSLI